MKRLFAVLAVAAAFFAAPAFSAPVTIIWNYSSKCADGSPAVNCPIANVKLFQRTTATGNVVNSATVPSSQTTYVTNLSPGPVCFSAIAITPDNAQSDESPPSCATVPSSKPGVIVITITIATAAPSSP